MDVVAGAASALQDSAYGAWARGPAYAALNLIHLLGLVLLVGGIGAVDLRLCGLGRGIPVAALSRLLTPFAIAGLMLAVASGSGLLAADAVSLLGSNTFRWKIALILLALLNAIGFRMLYRRRSETWDRDPPVLGAVMAAVSLALWLCVGALGRLIAYT